MMEPRTIGYSVSGVLHLAIIVWGVISLSFAPKKTDEMLEVLPVEFVSEMPSASKQGVKTAEKLPDVKKLVEKLAPPKPDDDDDDSPIKKEVVKKADAAPPPPPPPKVVETKPPPPPAPPQKSQAALQQEELEDKLAEIEAAKKKAEAKAKAETKAKADAKAKADKQAREDEEERLEKLAEAKAKAEKDAKDKGEKERLDRLKANKFDPSAIAAKTGSNATLNDKRDASRTEKTGEAVNNKPSAGTQTGRSASLSASELDGLRAQIEKCWNPPSTVTNAKDLMISIAMTMNPDGSVTGTPSVLNRQAGIEFVAAANAATRAIRQCSPYKLPAAKYDSWREIKLNFRPNEI